MIPIQIKIVGYNKERNTCTAKLLNNDIIELDPFVGCALKLSDEDYENGKAYEIVGNQYVLIEYAVHPDQVVPYENGMFLVSEGEKENKQSAK